MTAAKLQVIHLKATNRDRESRVRDNPSAGPRDANPRSDSYHHTSHDPADKRQATSPSDDQKKASSRYWTAEEHARFLEGLNLFGSKDIKSISRHVGTRSATQVRTHAQKYYLRVERERAKASEDGGKPRQKSTSQSASAEAGNSTSNDQSSSAGPAPTAVASSANNSVPKSQLQSHPLKTTRPRSPARGPPVTTDVPPQQPPHRPAQQQRDPRGNVKLESNCIFAKASDRPLPSPADNPDEPSHMSAQRQHRPDWSESQHGPQPSTMPPAHATLRPASGAPPTLTNPTRASAAYENGGTKRPRSTDNNAKISPKPSPKRRLRKTQSPPLQMPMTAPGGAASLAVGLGSGAPRQGHGVPVGHRAPNDKVLPMHEAPGSSSNLRTLLKGPLDDPSAPSGSRPPTLRRNGSSNSVLADLSKGFGMLSRSNSFLSPAGKGVTRSNSILSLLSGIPTALRESPSTERLLGLDGGEDKVLATLKAMDAGNNAAATAIVGPATSGGQSAGALGDRSLSFGQLHHMAPLDELEDPGAVALALQEEAKWADG